jgi:hypothetical protein
MFSRILLAKVFWIQLILCFLLGCAGSSVQIIKSNLKARPEATVYIMPVALPEEIGVAEDWRKTGEVVKTQEGNTIQKGIYQYSFSEGDITNLRNSLINSLIASKSFRDVIYLRNAEIDSTINHSAFFVYLKIDTTNMASGTNSKCLISGKIEIKSDTEQLLYEDDINIETNSLWSISDAKNKAIRRFVMDAMESFNKF